MVAPMDPTAAGFMLADSRNTPMHVGGLQLYTPPPGAGPDFIREMLDDFMATDGLSEQEVHERVLHIMRHWSVWPRWNRVNFPTYLERLYALTQALPPARRIRHHFTDAAADWAALTPEKMPDHWRGLANRDEQMARVIIDEMERLDRVGGRPAKSLRQGMAIRRAHWAERLTRALSVAIPVFAYICR